GSCVNLAPVNSPGDMNGDGLVAIQDWAEMANCISGPCPEPCPVDFIDACCEGADLDGDGDVDNGDVSVFLGLFEGEGPAITVLAAQSSLPVVAYFSGNQEISFVLDFPGAGQAAESFVGQSVTRVGDLEEVSGLPSIPLTLFTPGVGDNLFFVNNELQGVAASTPNPLVGEGAISFLFDFDQTEIGLAVNLMDGGTTTFQFFTRTGAPFPPVQVSHTGSSFYTFLSSLGATFAGVTITNNDLFGISVDELRFGNFGGGQNDISVLTVRSSAPVVADFNGNGVVSGILSLPGAGQAAEGFLGQTVTLVGDFEEVSGLPSIPMTLDTPGADDGLWLINDELQGESGGTPDILIGEGAMTFLFDADQTVMGLSVNLMDGGTTTFQFFSRTGEPFNPVQVSHTGNTFYEFLSNLGATFAGVTITNDDLFGISVDELRLGN
ncbi:MAG: hypothetical protein ACE5GE_01605, partial [Phycisphaerae bacterium]